VNVPVPDPPEAVEFAIVGLYEVAQQTPLAVTDDPPSDVTVPPAEDLVVLTIEIVAVETEGATARVVKLSWLP
jgi:hypothetical protein